MEFLCYNNEEHKSFMVKINKLKVLYKRYEGVLIPLALFFGFATDVLTFRLIQFTTSMVFLLCHFIFAGLNIAVINYFKDKKPESKITSYWNLFAPLFVQFSFGNLFSGFLIFYSKSGSFFASWPFLLVVVALLIGNEIARRYDVGPAIQIGAYFFALFSYFNLAFPYIFKRLDLIVFFASGFLSLVVISFFIHHLSNYSKTVKEELKTLKWVVSGVFLIVNFLYFSNLIPPIPLTLKDVGLYHEIERINDNYRVVTEESGIFNFGREIRNIRSDVDRLYFYSAIYAPPEMNLKVVHRWEKRTDNGWEVRARIPFNIYGGRDIGYRWYSYYSVEPGLWRVAVETERGQIVGRSRFEVRRSNEGERVIRDI